MLRYYEVPFPYHCWETGLFWALEAVWVAIFLKEYPSPMVLVGFAFILAGMLLDALLPSEHAQYAHVQS